MYIHSSNKLPLNLFIGIGKLEHHSLEDGIDILMDQIQSRNYDHFEYKKKVFAQLTHSTVVHPCWEEGLTWIFSGV